MEQDVKRYVQFYSGRMGLRVFPCAGKRPATPHGCKDATADPEQAAAWWGAGRSYNVGIATGGGLVVLDVDADHSKGKFGDETLAELERQHGPLPDTWQCLTGGGGVHYYFRCEDPALTVGTGFAPGLDYRGAGGYVVAPPSVHPDTGREYVWEAGHTPGNTQLAPLPDWLHQMMLGGRGGGGKPSAEAPEEIAEGQRNTALFKLAASLRAKGLTQEAITAALMVENRERCRPPLPEREVETIAKSAGRYERGALPVQEWGEPIPFSNPDTPGFPVESLPGAVGAFVEQLAESTQTPEEMGGILSLGVLSTAFQSKYEVEVTPDWREPLCLYPVAVAEPGERKSSVMSALSAPVYEYEKMRQDFEAAAIAQNRTERVLLEKALQAAQTRAAKGKGGFEAAREEALALSAQLANFKELHPFRLLVDDTTPEKLVDMMELQGGCITVASAEGGVFDSIAGRYDRAANFDIYLKGHAGDTISVDRIGRKSNYIAKPRLTMMLTIQPSVLHGLMDNATFRGRGLCGRFLYAMCKSKVGHREVSPATVTERTRAEYREFVWRILSDQGHGVVHLSPDANVIREEYQAHIEKKLGSDWEHMRDWGGKLVGAMVRIAALLHLSSFPADAPIGAETMAAATGIAEFLGAHAEAAYQMMGADEATADAKYLWRRIAATGQAEISKRNLFNICKGKFKRVEEMEAALYTLADMGYIQMADVPTGGRPTQKIMVNPMEQK